MKTASAICVLVAATCLSSASSAFSETRAATPAELAQAAKIAALPTPGPGDEFFEAYRQEVGNSGGSWNRQNDVGKPYLRSPVTGMEVCWGTRIDFIQLHYGTDLGAELGTRTPNCRTEKFTQAGDFVNRVIIYFGYYFDGITFVLEKGEEIHFGGRGGNITTVRPPDGGALAYIDVKDQRNDLIHRIEPVFGYPYKINNVQFDKVAALKAVAYGRPEQVFKSCLNNRNGVPEKQSGASFGEERTLTETTSTTFGIETSWGSSFEYSFDTLVAGEYTATLTLDQKFTQSSTNENTVSETFSYNYPSPTVPYGMALLGIASTRVGKINIPFSYEIVPVNRFGAAITDSKFLPYKEFKGNFEDVRFTSLDYEFIRVDGCDTLNPVSNVMPEASDVPSASDTPLTSDVPVTTTDETPPREKKGKKAKPVSPQ